MVNGINVTTASRQAEMLGRIGVEVLDKNLNVVKESGDSLINMMERSALERKVNPNIGGNIDILV